MMTNPITGQGAPKSARYGTSAQQEATAKQQAPSNNSSQTAVSTIDPGKDLPPINKVQPTSKIEKAVTQINDYVQSVSRDLQFSFEEELPLGRAVIKVLDTETQEVIRQFPAEEVIAIAEQINKQLEESDSVESFMLSEKI